MRYVSFVDCPGHAILMATMLSSAAIIDLSLLLIAGNESCSEPRICEYLPALEIMKLKHIPFLQNRIDLVKESQAEEQYKQILAFVKGTVVERAHIILISHQLKYSIEVFWEYVVKKILVFPGDFTSEPKLIIIQSFDINKHGCEVDDLQDVMTDGSFLRGVLKMA